jgi:hypothetical protein
MVSVLRGKGALGAKMTSEPNYKHRLKAQEANLLELLAKGPVRSLDHAKIAVKLAITKLDLCGYAKKLDVGWTITPLGRMALNHRTGLRMRRLIRAKSAVVEKRSDTMRGSD